MAIHSPLFMWAIIKAAAFFVLAFLAFPVQSAGAMVVAPSAVDVEAGAGEREDFTIVIGNDTSLTATYVLSFSSVDFGDSSEELSFAQPTTDILSWVTTDEFTFALGPNETREVVFDVQIPIRTRPQSTSFAVLVTEQPQGVGGVGVATAIASLIFLEVDGEELEQHLSISEFKFNGIEAQATILNAGQGILQPSVVVLVRNAFGRRVKEVDLNPGFSRLPAGMSRDFSGAIGKELSFFSEFWREIADQRIGIFTAELSVTSGDGSNTVTAEKRFWVLPWRSVLVIVTVLAFFVIARRIRSRS